MAPSSRPLWALGACAAVVAAKMEIPTTEIAAGVHMPVISIGTGGLERSAAANITRNWLSLGGIGIDTALMYGDQDVIAQEIKKAGVKRESLFITSKVPGCSLVRQSVEADLKALQTNYLDLLLIHFPRNGDCAVAWPILEDYHARGVLKAIGVSNFKQSNLEPVLKIAKVVPAVNQIEHNVLSHDDATIAFCKAHNIAIEAYSPLGRNSGDIPKNTVIQGIAATHNVSTFQVAMKWVLQHGHLVTFQSSSAEHQREDADVFGFTLSDGEMDILDKLQTVNPAPTIVF